MPIVQPPMRIVIPQMAQCAIVAGRHIEGLSLAWPAQLDCPQVHTQIFASTLLPAICTG